MKKRIKHLRIVLVISFLVLCSAIEAEPPEVAAMPVVVEHYLQKNGSDLKNYELSDVSTNDDYRYHELSYDVYGDIETVWRSYRSTEPRLAFKSRIMDFGVVFNPDDSAVHSSGESSLPLFKEGQFYVLDLKFLGIYSIPIAFKVDKIDSAKKLIEFVYTKNNICNGYQQISLSQGYDSMGKPMTHVDHVSFFKMDLKIIEKFIYPSFHKNTIDDFHKNVFSINHLKWEPF